MDIPRILEQQRRLPSSHGSHNVVQWHVFRSAGEAGDYARHIELGAGQRIVGGCDRDSVGPLWWVGVEVDDLARWGNRAAVNKRAQ